MVALEEVSLRRCRNLAATPLPASSAARVRALDLSGTAVERLPEGMFALEDLNVNRCRSLADCWLPASSAASLHTLNAERSNVCAVPAGASELRELSISESDCPKSSIPAAVLRLLKTLDGHAVHFA
jgi:hypothetical protein